MDPLSNILTLLNVRAALPSRMETGGRWAMRFKSYEHVKVGAVLSGSCWLTVDGAPPLHLEAGDCYLHPSDRPWEVASDLETEPADGHAVFTAAGPGTLRYGSDLQSTDRSVLIGGSISFDDTAAALLLDSLPPSARIGAETQPAQALRPTLQMLADETESSAPGTEVMGRHLTEILFVQIIRALLNPDNHREGAVPGWLGALGDPQMGAVLRLMHEQAGRRWTVASLAAAAGMSRTTFAERFKAVVGLSPMDYLLRRRMRSAAQILRTTDRTVASVAAEWGYASESAFSKAFTRVVGYSPAHHRPARPAPGRRLSV